MPEKYMDNEVVIKRNQELYIKQDNVFGFYVTPIDAIAELKVYNKEKEEVAKEEESAKKAQEKEAKEAVEASAQVPAKLISNKDEAFNYVQVKMPQAGNLTYISYEAGVYYFSADSGQAGWHITVDEAGNLTEEKVEEIEALKNS